MAEIQVSLPDNSVRRFEARVTVHEVIAAFNQELAEQALAGKIDGRVVDLARPIREDCSLHVVTPESKEALGLYRHSTSHVMAFAVQELFHNVQIGIGPSTEDGFYYDFRREESFTDKDLEQIEQKMREIIEKDYTFERIEMSKEECLSLFEKQKQDLKLELIREKGGDIVSCYRNDGFIDFCTGPHLPSTGRIQAFKLLSVAGAYWRGDEKNEMLQRIYGTAFRSKEDLDGFLRCREEAAERDHRKLGKELDFFSIHGAAGSGFIYWHPKGAQVREILEDYWRREHRRRGYDLVYTPHMARSALWQQSGHFDFYRDKIYTLDIEGEEHVVKPMNCPGHILIYNSQLRSYRDLPIRYAELGTVYRYERHGALHGMLRVRGFTQDDAHIFCRRDQLEEEIDGAVDFAVSILQLMGFEELHFDLSIRDVRLAMDYAGTDEEWEEAESVLRRVLEQRTYDFHVQEGEAVFYGPKIDLQLVDSLGRQWQGATVQFDFNLPQRFNVTYIGEDSKPQPVFMVHRALLGSLERFMGVLIEHYGGDFPLWLAPTQVRILPVTDRNLAHCQRIAETLRAAAIRVEVDDQSGSIGAKIRRAELEKLPYMLVVGDREEENETVAVRTRAEGDRGSVSLDALQVELCRLSDPENSPRSTLPSQV